MGKRVAIIQSNYIPWKGYFDIIRACDLFLLYDEVQYTRRDWRNRNRIRTAQGTQWLTVPVQAKGRYTQRIDETLVEPANGGGDWAERHWQTLVHAYAKAPHFSEIRTSLQQAYEQIATLDRLSDINATLLRTLCTLLQIDTQIRPSTHFQSAGTRTDRLLSLCLDCDATEYLSGPAAQAYLDESTFTDAGIGVRYAVYSGYPSYPQLHDEPFDHAVSVIDLLANVGIQRAGDYLRDVTAPSE